jgi:hypothetical protein
VSELLHCKDKQINNLKLLHLNLEHSVFCQAKNLTDFKCFLFAVAQGNIPHLHSLVATAQRCGSSIHQIMELVDLAIQQVYKPKSYSEIEFQRQYLFHKLGGWETAELAHCTLGMPSIDATREHMNTKALITSTKALTVPEMTENLKVSFCINKTASNASSNPTCCYRGPGYQVMADEVKVESWLHWDAC